MGRRRLRVLSFVVSFATALASLTVLAPSASAAENGVTDFTDTLTSLSSWTSGLDQVGKLADPLPFLNASAGGLLGFADLFESAVTSELASASSFDDLEVDQAVSIGGGRTGHLTTDVVDAGAGKRLNIVATAQKVASGEGFRISNDSPRVDLNLGGGVEITADASLAMSLVWTGATDDKVYVVHDATTPKIDVDASAVFDNLAAATAAIGILEVSIDPTSTLAVKAHFLSTISDPNNDGKLAFTETAANDGELAADGSLGGLVSVGFDSAGSPSDPGSRGSVSATVLTHGTTSGLPVTFPPVDATIGINWPDIGTGSPAVTAPDLSASVGRFLNMTPRDLADGLAQIMSTITAIQRAKFDPDGAAGPLPEVGNLSLPLMKGTLADAVAVSDALKDFIDDNTEPQPGDADFTPGVDDPAQAGNPTFVSIQELLTLLDDHGLMEVTGLDWNATKSKLSFTLGIEQDAPASPVDLDAQSAAASGGPGSTYGPSTLTVAGASWGANQWMGRRVVAGTSAGTVASNTANQITLTAPWIGGSPVNNTAFVISGPEPQVGAVSLADRLQNGTGQGITNANADNTFADVTPSFDASITLVLDLQDPKTGNDCIGVHGSTQACPFTRTNGDGSASVIESLPLNTDRFLVRTGSELFNADFPIETAVDLLANAGYFKVKITGNLKVCEESPTDDTCAAAPTATPMFRVGLKQLGDAEHDITLADLFDRLVDDPDSLLDIDVEDDINVQAYGSLSVAIPGAPGFLGSATAAVTAEWEDLTDPSTLSFDMSDLAEIFQLDFDANDPQALFAILVRTLQTLQSAVGDASPSGAAIFDQDIPILGRSLGDLLRSDESNAGPSVTYGSNTIVDSSRTGPAAFTNALKGRSVIVGTQVAIVDTVSATTLTMTEPWDSVPATGTPYAMRSALDDAIDRLLAAPPDNIQDAIALIDSQLGPGSGVGFSYLDDGGTPNLVLSIDWQRGYRAASPVRLDFPLGSETQSFAGVQGEGIVEVGVDGNLDIGLVIPLQPGDGPADGAALKILDDSSIDVGVDAALTNAAIAGEIGPLSIALGNPEADAPAAEKMTAKADLSLGLAKSGATGDPVTFDSFIGDVAPALNATNTPVDCGESLTTDLSVCATMPVFINLSGTPTGWDKLNPSGDNDFNLRLPDSTDAATLFTLTGDVEPGVPRFDVPDDLLAAIQNAILDFANFGTGLDAYLALVERSLQSASFDGKLPLIGEDLQQGSDFIGDLRTTLQGDIWNNLPGGGRPANSQEFENFINTNLDTALTAAGIDADHVTVDITCEAVLEAAGNPTVAPTPAAGATAYQYKIVAFQGSGPTVEDTVPSGIGSTATGPATLDGTNYNDLSWTASTGATGYRVLRKVGSEFKKIADVTGLTYRDNGSGTPATYTAETTEPELQVCDLEDISGAALEFDVAQGDPSATLGCVNASTNCFTDNIPLDIGIPGLSLRADRTGAADADGISVKVGWSLHLRLGLTRSDGFFVSTHDGWGASNRAEPELQLGLAFDLPDALTAELAILRVRAEKRTGSGPEPLFAGAFQLDLKSESGEGSCFLGTEGACTADTTKKLTLASLNDEGGFGDLVGVSLHGTFDLDWTITALVDSALPGIRTDFLLHWVFDNEAPEDADAPTIEFNNVGISAGKFFSTLLGPVVREIKRVTGPVQPIIDTLYAPIPVLSDLSRLAGGDDVTMISIAQSFSTIAGGPDLTFVDTIRAVIDFINRLPEGDVNFYVPLGNFKVLGGKALTTSNSPATADGLIDKVDGYLPQAGANVKTALDAQASAANPTNPPVFSGGGDSAAAGFTFPIIENPASAFGLIMGQDVTLVEFDSGPLTLGFSWRQSFGPVYAPPPVFITLSGSASVTLRVAAGLDTYGIRKVIESGLQDIDAVDALDGLFFKTVDAQGRPIPVVEFRGEIAAGASVSAVIIEVGVEGGVALTIGFLWNDPNNDGKFRVSEFLAAAISNPLCLFVTSGKISIFLRVYITIGISPFSTTFSFTLADVTLLDFRIQPDCTPPPPKLGGTVGDTLVVFAGKLGTAAFRGHSVWDNTNAAYEEDTVKVIALHFAEKLNPADPDADDNPDFDGFSIEMLGEKRYYFDEGLQRVVVDGTGYGKPMKVSFIGDGKTDDDSGLSTAVFDRDAVVIGSSQDDVIRTGTRSSIVNGRGGNDVIVTADTSAASAEAIVAGGGGEDNITTGHGGNRVAGDSGLGSNTRDETVTLNAVDGGGTKTVTVFDWTDFTNPGSGGAPGDASDKIAVGLGENTVFGNGGDDFIGVSADSPQAVLHPDDTTLRAAHNVLAGGTGSDRITGGSAGDDIFTAGHTTFGVDAAGPVDTGATNIVDTGTGSDNVYGSTGVDIVTGHSLGDQVDNIRGGAANDLLVGGFGEDKVYGGPDDDYVIAEPATVTDPAGPDDGFGPSRVVTHLALPTGVDPSYKLLVGGTGKDHIIGGDGGATIFGDREISTGAGNETCRVTGTVESDPVPESTGPGDGDGNDRILGGNGIDIVSAGGGNDVADLFGANDLGCGQQGGDVLRGGSADDMLWGGTNGDSLFGDAGADKVFGNSANDFLYGGTEVDILEGNNGSDWATGGLGPDVVYGGTRAAGRDDTGGDTLYGDADNDTLIGDNGTVAGPDPAIPLDLDGLTPGAGSGDTIHGGAGDDIAFGGLGTDLVNGNGENDHLEGNNAADIVHGNDGEDEVIGGSFEQTSPGSGIGRPDTGDELYGDDGTDVLTGDNADVDRVAQADGARVTLNRGFALGHAVTLLDLGSTPAAATSGNDLMLGGGGNDVLYGQSGFDREKGETGSDYVEGGPDVDWVEGNAGDDDLAGGSSTIDGADAGDTTAGQPDTLDVVYGGSGDDVLTGDNALVSRVGPFDERTFRVTEGAVATPRRSLRLLDVSQTLGNLLTEPTGKSGNDRLSGGSGIDVILGQDGADFISGGPDGDYAEGTGGEDRIWGDRSLADAGVSFPSEAWPSTAGSTADLEGDVAAPDGQDDLMGGSSRAGFRDAADEIRGNGAADYELGDNGTIVRDVTQSGGGIVSDPATATPPLADRLYAKRYADPAPAGAAVVRRPTAGEPSTRFCAVRAQGTCEQPGAYGADLLWGDAGDDTMYGQDASDQMWGGPNDDDMYGELGADVMLGEDGEDAMLGDRGGIMDFRETGARSFNFTNSQVPKIVFDGFITGNVTRHVDQLHDVNGDVFAAGPTAPAMPYDGIATGGDDRMLGGSDHDSMHGEFGDDLMNGQFGGDWMFGDDGADVMWGGRGSETAATPNDRGTQDSLVDYLVGGKGATTGPSVDPVNGTSGSDILDFRPRGSYPGNCAPGSTPVTTGAKQLAVTVDPCVWFEMTETTDADVDNNQHHHGIDWIYGSWDRDVLQANVADNGPNFGDRLLDWNGAYNLYTHCNAAYGGFNDVRQHSPDHQDFLQRWTASMGAGQGLGESAASGTSAFTELALVFPGEHLHGSGAAYPSTPGHFDEPSCLP